MSKNYGPEHRAAREDKLASLSVRACQITNSPQNLEAHHQVPKMFNGPDMEENLLILCRAYHRCLHEICNVKDTDLVAERIMLTKRIMHNLRDDRKVEAAKKRIQEIDNILMPEYINNIIDMGQECRQLLFETIFSNFQTIRSLSIENKQLRAKLQSISILP